METGAATAACRRAASLVNSWLARRHSTSYPTAKATRDSARASGQGRVKRGVPWLGTPVQTAAGEGLGKEGQGRAWVPLSCAHPLSRSLAIAVGTLLRPASSV